MAHVTGEATRGLVLLVEDDVLIRGILERVLHEAGYSVVVAGDGPTALDLASQAGHVDLLVTDVVLPGMSGPEVADELGKRLASLRVLFVSGYGEKAFSPSAMLPPSVDWLAKPFSPRQLVAKVDHLLAV